MKFLLGLLGLSLVIANSYAANLQGHALRDVKTILVEKNITEFSGYVAGNGYEGKTVMEAAQIELDRQCRKKADGRAFQTVTSKRCIKMKEEYVREHFKCLAICTYERN